MNNKGLIIASVFLGVSLIACAGVAGYSFYKIRAASNVISVTGSAEKVITSDIVKWYSGFSRNVGANDVKQGYADMARDLEKTLVYLRAQGIADADITVRPVMMNPLYEQKGYGQGGIIGYSFQQTIEVRATDVVKITKIAQDAPAKIAELGVLFASQNLEYYYSKFSDLKVEMLSEATKNAKSRAEKIAESTGARIQFLQSASMGVFQVTAVNSMEVSDYGYFDTSSIEKKVTSVVRASFSLQ